MNAMKEITPAQAEEVNGGFFFLLLAVDVAILAYDAYQLSKG